MRNPKIYCHALGSNLLCIKKLCITKLKGFKASTEQVLVYQKYIILLYFTEYVQQKLFLLTRLS